MALLSVLRRPVERHEPFYGSSARNKAIWLLGEQVCLAELANEQRKIRGDRKSMKRAVGPAEVVREQVCRQLKRGPLGLDQTRLDKRLAMRSF